MIKKETILNFSFNFFLYFCQQSGTICTLHNLNIFSILSEFDVSIVFRSKIDIVCA